MSCSHQGCQGVVAYRPILKTRSRTGGKITDVVLIQLGYCQEHRDSYKVENLLSSEGHTKLAKFMREKGVPEPEHRLTSLGWSSLSTEEIADLEGRQHFTQTGDDDLAF